MTMHDDESIFSQSQQGATLSSYEPTLRQKTQAAIEDYLSSLGLNRSTARTTAIGITGSEAEEARLLGIGLADFTPLGFGFGAEEAARDFKKAESPVDYIAPSVELGLSAVEAFPLTKAITRPVIKFLSNISSKTKADVPVDLGRRKAITGLAVAPAVAAGAGALSKFPVEKVAKTPVDYSELRSSVYADFPNDLALLDTNKLKKYFESPKELFDWFDSGITENLLLPEPKKFLQEAGGDLEKANEKIMQEMEDLVGAVHFQSGDDFIGTEFFRENITEPLIEDLMKASK